MATTTKQNSQFCTTSPSIDANIGPWDSINAYLAWLSEELGIDTPQEGTEILIKASNGTMTKYRYEVVSGTASWKVTGSVPIVTDADTLNTRLSYGIYFLASLPRGILTVSWDYSNKITQHLLASCKPVYSNGVIVNNEHEQGACLLTRYYASGAWSNWEEIGGSSGGSSGGEANVIETVKVNGSALTPSNKEVNIPLASTSADGVMSKEDKAALDAVSTTYETKSDATTKQTAVNNAIAALQTQVAEVTGVKNANFGGVVAAATDIAADYTEKGYTGSYLYMVGSDMASLVAYQYSGSGDPVQLFSGATYDFTDYANVVAEVGRLGPKIGQFEYEQPITAALTSGGAINGQSGALDTTWYGSYSYTDYIAVTAGDEIEIAVSRVTSANNQDMGIAFYNSSKTYVCGAPRLSNAASATYEIVRMHVPYGVSYLRASISTAYASNFYIKKVVPLNKLAESELVQEPFEIVYTMFFSQLIASGLSVGDTVAFSSNSYCNVAFSATKGAKGVWIPVLYYSGLAVPPYVVVDSNNKILKIGSESPADTQQRERTYYVNLTDIDGAVGIYWRCSTLAPRASHIYRDYGNINVYKGNLAVATITDGVKLYDINDDAAVYSKSVVNDGTNNTIVMTFEESQLCANVGIYLKCNSRADYNKISTLKFAINDGSSNTQTFTTGTSQIIQTEDWVFIKFLPQITHTTKYVKSITIKVNFASGEDSTSEVFLSFCNAVVLNHFDKPMFVVNFDHTWAKTEECGAYDYLHTNKIPYSITGVLSSTNTASSSYISDEMLAEIIENYRKGLVDIGQYGGGTDPDGTTAVTPDTEYQTAFERACLAIQLKAESGYNNVSFGTGQHLISQKMLKAVKAAGFKMIRCGVFQSTGADVGIASTRDKASIMMGGIFDEGYMALGGCGSLFVHGVDTTSGTYYMAYSDFVAYCNVAVSEAAKGGCLLMNMRMYGEMRERVDLFGPLKL